MTNISKSTGPKTEQGKANSSKNAQKGAIFTQGYLPWEDGVAKEQEFQSMCRHWGAHDPLRQMLLRNIQQASIASERLALAQRQQIEGLMCSEQIKKRFAQEAGFSLLGAERLPMWYFAADDGGEKELALRLARVQAQATQLRSRFTDQLVAQIEQRFPDLYAYVMQGQLVNTPFLIVLGQRYKQPTPTLNFGAVVNEISEKFPDHIDWADDPQRYQTIIDGLRAELMVIGMDLEKSTRYATTFQNRMIKGMQALAALDIHERQKAQFDLLQTQTASLNMNCQSLEQSPRLADQAQVTLDAGEQNIVPIELVRKT